MRPTEGARILAPVGAVRKTPRARMPQRWRHKWAFALFFADMTRRLDDKEIRRKKWFASRVSRPTTRWGVVCDSTAASLSPILIKCVGNATKLQSMNDFSKHGTKQNQEHTSCCCCCRCCFTVWAHNGQSPNRHVNWQRRQCPPPKWQFQRKVQRFLFNQSGSYTLAQRGIRNFSHVNGHISRALTNSQVSLSLSLLSCCVTGQNNKSVCFWKDAREEKECVCVCVCACVCLWRFSACRGVVSKTSIVVWECWLFGPCLFWHVQSLEWVHHGYYYCSRSPYRVL